MLNATRRLRRLCSSRKPDPDSPAGAGTPRRESTDTAEVVRAHCIELVDFAGDVVRVLDAREGPLTLSLVGDGAVYEEVDLEGLTDRVEFLERSLEAAAVMLAMPWKDAHPGPGVPDTDKSPS